MTRKKFIKTLMAHKVQRDDAVRIAELVNVSGERYETMWNVFLHTAEVRALRKMNERIDEYYGL